MCSDTFLDKIIAEYGDKRIAITKCSYVIAIKHNKRQPHTFCQNCPAHSARVLDEVCTSLKSLRKFKETSCSYKTYPTRSIYDV